MVADAFAVAAAQCGRVPAPGVLLQNPIRERESLRYQVSVNAVRSLASNRGLPAWDIIPGLTTWHLGQPAELERAPGPRPAGFRTEFLRQTVA
jgi:hypothetical protein